MYMYTHMCHIYIYIYIYIYTYIHTYIYIYMYYSFVIVKLYKKERVDYVEILLGQSGDHNAKGFEVIKTHTIIS